MRLPRKPEGRVQVDWSNPLTRDLHAFYVFNEGGGLPRNIAGTYKDSESFASTDPAWEIAATGRVLDFNGDTESILRLGLDEDSLQLAGKAGLTIIQGLTRGSSETSDEETLISNWDSSASNRQNLLRYENVTDSGRLESHWEDSTDAQVTLNAADIKIALNEYSVITQRVLSTELSVFKNGIKSATTATLDSVEATLSTNQWQLGFSPHSTTDDWRGSHQFLMVFHRGLPDNEIRSLSYDPWQALKSKKMGPFLAPVAAVAAILFKNNPMQQHLVR